MDATKQVKATHVLIALHRFESGGAERQALYLAVGLSERGYKVTVIAFGKEEGLALERFKGEGINALATGFNERLILDNPVNLKSRFLKWKYTRKLITFIKGLEVDVIFPFTYPPNMIFGSLWRQMKTKACYWNQRDEGRLFQGKPREQLTLENCTKIISNSMVGKLFLERFTSHDIDLIYNGVEVTLLDSRRYYEIVKVVMVANLHKHKDHLTLLKAWSRIRSQAPNAKVHLYLAGKELNATEEIMDYINQYDLKYSVTCLGQVTDIASLLAESHIGVFSSFNEGLPNGILECMAAGLPVVANRILGAEELLGEDCPFLFNTGDDEKMANLLMELLRDSGLREDVGRGNQQRARDMFNMKLMLDRYQELIQLQS